MPLYSMGHANKVPHHKVLIRNVATHAHRAGIRNG